MTRRAVSSRVLTETALGPDHPHVAIALGATWRPPTTLWDGPRTRCRWSSGHGKLNGLSAIAPERLKSLVGHAVCLLRDKLARVNLWLLTGEPERRCDMDIRPAKDPDWAE